MRFLDATGLAYFGGKIRTALSAKQDALTGSAGQLIGIGDDGAAKATVYPSNKDQLYNSYFIGGGSQQGSGQFPINQRGEIKYTATGYSVDGWGIWNFNKIEVADDCVAIYPKSSSGVLKQVIENPSKYIEKTLTLSFLIDCPSGASGSICFADSVGSPRKSTGFNVGGKQIVSCTWVATNEFHHIELVSYSTGSSPVKLYAAKLELGDVQTLAHQENGQWVLNDPPPDFGEELQKCMRYYVRFPGLYHPPVIVNVNKSSNAAHGTFFIPLPVEMRSNPTCTVSGQYTLLSPVGTGDAAGISWSGTGIAYKNGVRFSAINAFEAQIVNESGMTFMVTDEDGVEITLSAEL